MNKDNYAFSQMRDIQVDIIERIEEAFREGYKYVMLEAPTGLGKSAISMSLSLEMGESFIITSSKLLQDQYLRDFAFSKTIKGRSNFECINPDSFSQERITCDAGACTYGDGKYICSVKPSREDYHVLNRGLRDKEEIEYTSELKDDEYEYKKRCRYFDQKYIGLSAGYTILNYKYFFSMAFYNQSDISSRSLVVFDEAHNIENQILDFISINPSPSFYRKIAKDVFDEYLSKNIKLPVEPTTSLIEDWLLFLKETEKWMETVKEYYGPTKIFAELVSALSRISHVTSLIEQDKQNWVVDLSNDKVKISPIEIGQYVKPLFDYGKRVLFISATLLDKSVFANMIGVSPSSEVKFIKINESPFPKKNRPIILRNLGVMNYKTMDSLLPSIVLEIDSILQKHRDERGIIHCTSYKQLEYIISKSNYKSRLIRTEPGIPQSDILKKAFGNSVIISPSMHEGVDLKDDLSRFQITVKIPYLDLNDKRTAAKARRSPNWYKWNAIIKLVQGIGRSVRSEEDYAVTYILDSKAGYILNDYMVPTYIKEAIIR